MAGRRSTLTPELRERIEHELARGVPVTVTAQRVGVPVRTLHSWLAAGKVERREAREPEPIDAWAEAPAETGAAPTPVHDLDERLRAAEPGLVAVVLAAAQRGSWQAAMRLLEAIDPSRWGRQRQPTTTPATRPSSRESEVGQLLGELDELAARRARMPR